MEESFIIPGVMSVVNHKSSALNDGKEQFHVSHPRNDSSLFGPSEGLPKPTAANDVLAMDKRLMRHPKPITASCSAQSRHCWGGL